MIVLRPASDRPDENRPTTMLQASRRPWQSPDYEAIAMSDDSTRGAARRKVPSPAFVNGEHDGFYSRVFGFYGCSLPEYRRGYRAGERRAEKTSPR